MLHLFHGDNIAASRKELNLLREKFSSKEIIILDGKTVGPAEIAQATESISLFGSDRLVIIENFFNSRSSRKKEDGEQIKKWLAALPQDHTLVFWESKELGKTYLNLFPPDTDFALFKVDKLVFQFVENLVPNKTKSLLELYQQLIRDEAVELVFAMIVRQFRLLIMAKDLDSGQLGLAPWQASKIQKQASFFSGPQLIIHYSQLLTIDGTIKTGLAAFPMDKQIELFLMQL